MSDSMRAESGPKTTEGISPNNAEAAAIKTVSWCFQGLGERAKDIARMATMQPALTLAALALMASSGCANAENPNSIGDYPAYAATRTQATKYDMIYSATATTEAVRYRPEATATASAVLTALPSTPAKVTVESVKTPEKTSTPITLDGHHALVIPHSKDLDGKKGMAISISFKPEFSESLAKSAEGTLKGDYLVVGGNDGQGSYSYALRYITKTGKDGNIEWGIEFNAGEINRGFYPSEQTGRSKSDQSTITVDATVDQFGEPQIVVNGISRKDEGYGFSSKPLAADINFNNNENPILVGANLNNDRLDGEFRGTIESLQINGNNINLNSGNLKGIEDIHR